MRKTKPKPPQITADLLGDVRCELSLNFEQIGEVLSRLRLAMESADNNNPTVAADFADEAGQRLFSLREQFEEYAGRCYRFRNWVLQAQKGSK